MKHIGLFFSKLNDHIEWVYFKIETLKSVLNLVNKGTHFEKKNKDAYYTAGISRDSRTFF